MSRMEGGFTSNADIFRELDAGFIGFSGSDLEYVWSTKDMIVQWSWELAVPVPIPGCELKFEFETKGYDIGFQVVLDGEDQSSTTLLSLDRYNSHQDKMSGQCNVPKQGTARLTWDNSYSWFTPKALSYHVTVTLPEHRIAEASRSTRAQLALAATKDDVARAALRLRRTREAVSQLHSEIPVLKQKLELMQMELQNKLKGAETAAQEVRQLERRIGEGKDRTLGLCIRFLGAGPLRSVIQFADPSVAGCVCKYWSAIAKQETHSVAEVSSS